MNRLRFIAALAIAALTVVPTSALAARVQIRVEGRTQTIYAAAPRTLDASNALEALDRASLAGEFFYGVTTTSFGPFVSQIGRFPGEGASGWVYKVNGASPPVGADKVQLKDGDVVLWYWATFDAAGAGPSTLELVRGSDGCYTVRLEDANGVRTAARGATLVYDGRQRVAATGRSCLPKHRSLVRATLPGAVRSNAVR